MRPWGCSRSQAGQSGQVGEAEASFTSLILTTNVIDDNLPPEVPQNTQPTGTLKLTRMVWLNASRDSINKKSFRSETHGKQAFFQCNPQYREQRNNIKVLDDRALPLNSLERGIIRTWDARATLASGWRSVPVKDEERVLLMHISKETLTGTDCAIIQQMEDARLGKEERRRP